MSTDRHHRQTLLRQIGDQGQQRLARSTAVLVGCGALGTTIADQLVRAGLGHLVIADRDIVELTNLQRQTLFNEADVEARLPKAIAAAERLASIDSQVHVTPLVTDVHNGNIETLIPPGVDVILDGTDNVQTRYLINDLAIKRGIPWIYGAAVGVEGRMMAIVPGMSACLRCLFPTPPAPHELPTCDTAGVLGMGPAMVGAAQAAEAIKLLTGAFADPTMLVMELWPWRLRTIHLADARREDCRCCAARRFDFLDAPPADSALSLCGRSAVQVRPTEKRRIELSELATRLETVGTVERSAYFVKCELSDPTGIKLTVFPDGRAIVQGTTDMGRAKSVYARFLGL